MIVSEAPARRKLPIKLREVDEKIDIRIGLFGGLVQHLRTLVKLGGLKIDLGQVLIPRDGLGHFLDRLPIGGDGLVLFLDDGVDQPQPGKQFTGRFGIGRGLAQEIHRPIVLLELEQPSGNLQDERLVGNIRRGRLEVFVHGHFRFLIQIMENRGRIMRVGIGPSGHRLGREIARLG